MKNLYKLFLLCLIPGVLSAQIYLEEDFSGGFPPAGWTIDAQSGNWAANNSNNAGGEAPEARLNWSPQFNGTTHLISPQIDLTDVSALKVKFKYMLDHYSGAYTIGVATCSNGGSWNTIWEKVNPTGSIDATEELVTISNTDLGASDFQICWFFSGNSYNLNYWYIDDIEVFTPMAHDAMVQNILVDPQYIPGSTVTPQAIIKNFGLNEETFDATCAIKVGGNVVYSQTCAPVTLAPDAEETVTFTDYIANDANELFEISITTNLTGDLNNTNDEMTKWFNTYTTSRDLVILEIGTGTWCPYCPGAAMGADELISNGQSVAVIEYHNSGGDPFQNQYSTARVNYYGITGYPTAVFDGVKYFIGGSNTESMYDNYLPLYEERIPINVPYTINVFGENDGDDYTLSVVVNKIASTQPFDDIVLQVALTESEIPYSWQGQNILNFVERLMFPDANGTPLDFSSGNQQTYEINFSIDPSWIEENCEIVAFIQNNADKEIHQAAKVGLTELESVPVELVSFTSTTSSEGVTLLWTTATEINNHGFEIERSVDGEVFSKVGFAQGMGTTSESHNYYFFDKVENTSERKLYYRLKQIDFDGNFSYTDVINVELDIPEEFSISQNFPNPFNPSTKIKYAVPDQELVTIKLYDLTGQEVQTLVNEVKEPGTYTLKFKANNLASGLYIYRMTAGKFVSVKKMSVLK